MSNDKLRLVAKIGEYLEERGWRIEDNPQPHEAGKPQLYRVEATSAGSGPVIVNITELASYILRNRQ